MKIGMVAAMGNNKELGYKNMLPWKRMDNDMNRFHSTVKDKVVIMGWNSYNSLPIELGWRYMIVISSKIDVKPKFQRSDIVFSREEALVLAKEKARDDDEEIIIIGGGKTYADFIPFADTLYLTYIFGSFTADVYFPEIDKNDWVEAKRKDYELDDKNPYPYSFVTLIRKKRKN